MRISKNKLHELHPRSLLYTQRANIVEFDNRHEFLKVVKDRMHKQKHQPQRTIEFFKNLDEYKVDTDLVEKVRNQVLNNLIKRGIVTGTVYEGYKYEVEGEILDVAELSSGNPMCFMNPIKKYDKYFYELYINMSIPWMVDNEDINEGAIRLVETIKALEELHIEIKITIVDFATSLRRADTEYPDHLTIVPLFGHLEYKDHKNLLPYTDSAMRRGPLFNCLEFSDTEVDSSLGRPHKLPNTVNLWDLKDGKEVELAQRIIQDLDIKGIL